MARLGGVTNGSGRARVVEFESLPPVACPCGTARRAFADVLEFPATIHVTEIKTDAEAHYHKHITETYYFLECGPEAAMQLDADIVPVKAGMCILIPPGVWHRAVGQMRVLIVAIPKFDPDDEYLE
jgi:quercetin dioxygenase-like cupin family protein